MSRPLRICLPGGHFHVMGRANAGNFLFQDDRDRFTFLEIARRSLSRYCVDCFAYCLMPNHYHLLVRTPFDNLSSAVRQINSPFAQALHRRYGTYGHVFQGRFRGVLVEEQPHLLEVARYIALNPVRAELVRRPREYFWSSHRAMLGLAEEGIVAVDAALRVFSASGGNGRRRYLEFVEDGLPAEPDGVVLGSRDFAISHVARLAVSPEIPSRHWRAGRPALRDLLAFGDLDRAIATAHREHGYRLREIGAALGCHYSTVSRRLARWEAGLWRCKT